MAHNLYGGVVIAQHHDDCCVAMNGDVMVQLVIGAVVDVEMLKTKVSEADTIYSPIRGTFTRVRRLTLAYEAISLMELEIQTWYARRWEVHVKEYSRCKFLTCHEISRQCFNHVKMSFFPKVPTRTRLPKSEYQTRQNKR